MGENENKQWSQIRDFLKKAGEEMKRVGEDVKNETTRLVDDLRDPEKQQKAKEKLTELGTWAKQNAQNAAALAETAVLKIEEGLSTATDYVSETLSGRGKTGAAETPAPTPPRAKKAAAKKAPARKAAAKKKTAKPAKTIGRKKKS